MQKLIENINNNFFDGHYKDIWRNVFPDKTTLQEVDFIIKEANLQKGDSVLDIMCGYGRHSIELAKRGFNVTAVDNLSDYIIEIQEKSNSQKLKINCIHSDVLKLKLEKNYDAIICMGNSIQFFNYEELLKLFGILSQHIKYRGKFVINTWMIMEIAVNQFNAKGWSRINNLLFLTESKWFFQPTRIETESIIYDECGNKEEKKGIDYIFSISEVEKIMQQTGFFMSEIYSVPGIKKFSIGEPRAYIVAEKI